MLRNEYKTRVNTKELETSEKETCRERGKWKHVSGPLRGGSRVGEARWPLRGGGNRTKINWILGRKLLAGIKQFVPFFSLVPTNSSLSLAAAFSRIQSGTASNGFSGPSQWILSNKVNCKLDFGRVNIWRRFRYFITRLANSLSVFLSLSSRATVVFCYFVIEISGRVDGKRFIIF